MDDTEDILLTNHRRPSQSARPCLMSVTATNSLLQHLTSLPVSKFPHGGYGACVPLPVESWLGFVISSVPIVRLCSIL